MKAFLIAFVYFFTANAFAVEASGQKIDAVAPGSTYEKLGLKPGDKIISSDGKPINSPKDSMELYTSLKTGLVKTVVIERNGKKETLKYEIE